MRPSRTRLCGAAPIYDLHYDFLLLPLPLHPRKIENTPPPTPPIIKAREILTSVEKLGYKKCVFTDVSPENIQILE